MINKLVSGLKLIRANVSKTPYVVLYVTNKCDLNCPFCFNRETRLNARENVDALEYRKLARSIRNPFEILLSGGEPFLREDLAEILSGFIRYSNPAVITIPTNGSQTSHIASVLEAIRSQRYRGRLHINLSIDGPGEEHDRIRGSKNLHQRIQESAKVIKSFQARNRNIWLGVISVVGEHNDTQVESLIRWVHQYIAPDIHDIGLERDFIDKSDAQEIISKYEEIQKCLHAVNPPVDGLESRIYTALMNYLYDSLRARKPSDGCRAGRTITVITTDGKAFPCEPFWISPKTFTRFENTCLGDLHDFNWDLPSLLTSPDAQTIIAKVRAGECRCFWECALLANLLFTHKGWMRMGRAVLRLN